MVPRSSSFAVFAILAAVALAGCNGDGGGSGNSIAIVDEETLPDIALEKSLSCGSTAEVVVAHGAGDNGSLTVTVRDGNNVPRFDDTFRAGAQLLFEESLVGNSGTWRLRVERSFEFDDSFRVTLRC